MKGNGITRRDQLPALLLALGFSVSAIAVFGLAWVLGAGLLGSWHGAGGSSWPAVAIRLAAVVVLVVHLVADLGRLGLRTPMWNRQTPKWFMYRFGDRKAALFWGLDAGLVFTTIRITSLSWAALALTWLGLLPWWAGAAYALGFVVPELVFDLLVPRRTDPTGRTDPEPVWIVAALSRLRPKLKLTGAVTLTLTIGWLAVTTLV